MAFQQRLSQTVPPSSRLTTQCSKLLSYDHHLSISAEYVPIRVICITPTPKEGPEAQIVRVDLLHHGLVTPQLNMMEASNGAME
jgi:hypothetical protein